MPNSTTSKLKTSSRDERDMQTVWKEQQAVEERGRVTTHIYLRRDTRRGVYGIRIASWYHEENTAPRKVVTTEQAWPSDREQPLAAALAEAVLKHGTQVEAWRAQYEMSGEAP